MKVLFAMSCALGAVAIPLALVRWLRVAQREHYLPGSVSRFASRWWRDGILNFLLGLGALASFVATAIGVPISFVAGIIIVIGPVGLSPRGRTSRLSWTRRLKTLGVVFAVLAALVVLSAAISNGLRGATIALGAVAIGAPVLVDVALFVVAPIESALAQRYVRRAAEQVARISPTIVGITGSYGKTSTKGYLAHLLRDRFRVVASPASFNNQAGLARTVNEHLSSGTEVLIAEMGTYGPGEIARMCTWLPPSIAIITAIGPVHLERFRSLDRTLAAKSEIAVGAATVVLNIDDERLAVFAETLTDTGKRVVRCSGLRRDVSVAVLEDGDQLEIVIDGTSIGRVQLNDSGIARTNVACALGAAITLGCDPTTLLASLGSLPVAAHRLEVRSAANGALVLDDTFNSNPAGARLALETLKATGTATSRRVVVTPGMVELGPIQFAENAAFAQEIAKVATELVLVGKTNRKALRAGIAAPGSNGENAGTQPTVVEVATREEAVTHVSRHADMGDVVLYENDLPDHYP